MQIKTVVLSGFLGLAAAASSDLASLVAELPSCSLPCLEQGASAADCGTSDYSCQCSSQDTITANATSCLTTSCSITNITTTQSVMSQICDAVNGNSSSTASNSTASETSSSSSASSTGTGSSAGSHPELYGLGWAAVAGVAGLLAL